MATDSMVLCSSYLTRKSRQLLLMPFLTEKTRVWKYADVISSIFRNLCCTNKQYNSVCSETRFLYQLSVCLNIVTSFHLLSIYVLDDQQRTYQTVWKLACSGFSVWSYHTCLAVPFYQRFLGNQISETYWYDCGIPLQNSQCLWAF